MTVVLLDTNCLIDLAAGTEPQAQPLRTAVEGFRRRDYELVAAAISASENPRRDAPPKTWDDLTDLLARASLARARVLEPMMYWDVTFWGHALWVDDEMKELEEQIHCLLAPSFEMDDRTDLRKWRNTKCDVQLVWTALWHETDVLVTSDRGILAAAPELAMLGTFSVTSPAGFVDSP